MASINCPINPVFLALFCQLFLAVQLQPSPVAELPYCEKEEQAFAKLRKMGAAIKDRSPPIGFRTRDWLVDLSGTQVLDADLTILRNIRLLGAVDLSNTKVTDLGIKEVASIGWRTGNYFGGVRTLALRNCQISNKALEYLSQANQKLYFYLDVRGTQIDDSGLKHLENVTIVSLLLAETKVTAEGLKHVGGVLWVLDLSSTHLGDKAMPRLTRFESLKVLNLANTQITDDGVAHLKELSMLAELDLAGTKVTDKGLLDLASLQYLKKLDVRRTKVTPVGIRALQKLLPQLKVQH